MKQIKDPQTNSSTDKPFIDKILDQLKDLIEITYELKIAVYKMIDIPIQDISFKARNDSPSILTNLKSIYFDLRRIESIIAKSKSRNNVDINALDHSQKLKASSSKSHLIYNPFDYQHNKIIIHSQVQSQVNLRQNFTRDLKKRIKYNPSNTKKTSKTEYFNLNQMKNNFYSWKQQQNVEKLSLNSRNGFQQKIIKISNKLNFENNMLSSINNFQSANNSVKRSNFNSSLKDVKDEQFRSSAYSKCIIQKIRNNRKQLLQFVRLKQKNCLSYINNICQSSSIILSKKNAFQNSMCKENISPISQNQRNTLKMQLHKELQQI